MSLHLPNSITNQFRPLRRIAGFSMIELLITVAIAIILAVVAVPQYSSFIQTSKAVNEITNLYNDMQFARSEALKEGQTVSLCISSNGTGCTTTTPNWDQGWIIYSNPTSAAAFVSGTSILLKAQPAFSTTDTITTTPAATTAVNFNRDGFAVGVSSTTGLLFDLHTSPVNEPSTRCLWIGSIGNQFIQTKQSVAVTGQGTNICT
jgi:type IV fimbrial biogenesis protein FimT